MDTELRPLSLGEILDRTFQIYRSRFLLFAGIAVVAATIRLIFGGGLLALTRTLAGGHHTVAIAITSSTGSLVSAGVSLLATGLTFAAITFAVTQIYLERPTTISDAYHGVRLHLWRYAGLNLVFVLLPWLPVIVLGVGMGIFIAASPATTGGPLAQTAVGLVALFGLFLLLAAPLCLWLASRYALANAAAISESLTIRGALQRSVTLSEGTRGRIILAIIVIAVVQFALSMLFMSPIFTVIARNPAHPPLWLTVYQLAIGFVSSVIFTPIYGVVLALFYYDARIRKEGFDVEWLLDRTQGRAPFRRAGRIAWLNWLGASQSSACSTPRSPARRPSPSPPGSPSPPTAPIWSPSNPSLPTAPGSHRPRPAPQPASAPTTTS